MILLLALAATAGAVGDGATGSVAHEVYVHGGVGYHSGTRQLAVGLGGGAGYRLHLGDVLSLHADLASRFYVAPLLEVGLGAVASATAGAWRPGVGLELAAFAGPRVRIVTVEDPMPVLGPAVGLRVLVRPLAFREDDWTVSALAVGWGRGLEAPGTTLSLGVDLLEIGRLF